MTQTKTGIQTVMEEFMSALQARDWARMAATLAVDVRRVGPEDERTDAVVGRKPYLDWLAGFADPLFEYGWTVNRMVYSDCGRVATVDCTTRYLLTEDAVPFGYRLVMIFDVGDDNLIHNIDLYWKTPAKRVPGDTIAAGKQGG